MSRWQGRDHGRPDPSAGPIGQRARPLAGPGTTSAATISTWAVTGCAARYAETYARGRAHRPSPAAGAAVVGAARVGGPRHGRGRAPRSLAVRRVGVAPRGQDGQLGARATVAAPTRARLRPGVPGQRRRSPGVSDWTLVAARDVLRRRPPATRPHRFVGRDAGRGVRPGQLVRGTPGDPRRTRVDAETGACPHRAHRSGAGDRLATAR